MRCHQAGCLVAPARQFAGDRRVGDVVGLLAFFELVPAMVQTAVPGITAGPGCRRGEVPAVADRLAGNVAVLVMPGGFNQQPAGMTVAGLGDRPQAT